MACASVIGRAHRIGTSRNEGQRRARACGGLRHSREEVHGSHVLEGIGQVLSEQHPHRALAARAQAARGGVWADVTAGGGCGQDALTGGRCQLVRAVIRVGHRGAGNPEFGGERGQRGAANGHAGYLTRFQLIII